MIATATRQQFFTAVSQLGDLNLVYQAVLADTNSAVWVEFNSADIVKADDALAQTTQYALNWTSAQMEVLFDTAANIVV